MKALVTMFFGIFILTSCRGNNVKVAELPHAVRAMVFDESSSELLVSTPLGVMRYGADGELIQGPRESLLARFEEVRTEQGKTGPQKSPASITQLAQTPFGVVSYDEKERNLYLTNYGSYPRLIVSNIERPQDIVYSRVSGRLFFSLAKNQTLMTLLLRPAI